MSDTRGVTKVIDKIKHDQKYDIQLKIVLFFHIKCYVHECKYMRWHS